jgi:O-antigen/teichoic acid export membrane protein
MKQEKIKIITSYLAISCSMALGFILMYAITKYGSLEVFGQFSILKSTAGLLSGILTFRTGEAVTKYYQTYYVSGEFEKSKLSIIIGLCIDLLISALLIIIFYVISTVGYTYFNFQSEIMNVFFLFGFTSIFSILRGSSIGYFQAKNYILYINIFSILESLLIISLIGLIIIHFGTLDLRDVVLIHICVYGLITIFYYLTLLFYYKREFCNFKCVIDKSLIKEYARFSITVFTSSLLKAVNRNSDNVILGIFLSTTDVGLYNSIKKVFSSIEIIAHPWTMLTYGKLVALYTRAEITQFKLIIESKTRFILLLSLLLGLLLLLNIKEIFSYMGVTTEYNLMMLSIVMMVSFLINSMVWWSRVFSNVVDPMISVKANFCTMLYQLIWVPVIIYMFTINGAIFSVLALNIMLAAYILKKYMELGRK